MLHPGPFPLSEAETLAVANYMDKFKHNLALYVATHSYGPMVLWPYGFAFDLYVNNWNDHQTAGDRWRSAILARGADATDYEVGNSADILYTANGASDDHAISIGRAKMAFTVELPQRGNTGFVYPEEFIYDLVQETFIGYRELGLYIAETYA